MKAILGAAVLLALSAPGASPGARVPVLVELIGLKVAITGLGINLVGAVIYWRGVGRQSQ